MSIDPLTARRVAAILATAAALHAILSTLAHRFP